MPDEELKTWIVEFIRGNPGAMTTNIIDSIQEQHVDTNAEVSSWSILTALDELKDEGKIE